MISSGRNPKDRFSTRVGDYVRFRPSYPPSVVSLPGNVHTIADVGSGTGIFTGLLLEAGYTVHAIEPNASMRKAAESKFSMSNRFHSVAGEAEHTGLPDRSVDAVTSAQAFHWFATSGAVAEFARILVPGGLVMLLWNDRKTDGDRFHREYENLLLRFGTDYAEVNHRNITEERIRKLFDGWHFERKSVENHQLLNLEGLKGRVESSSYSPPAGHPHHQPLMEAIESLFRSESAGDLIKMEYDCVVYLLRKVGG